ncbi:30S ribosomal protein S6, partial [bacterium]|nr:30S ribosomal protein S6 [bacterium]
YIIDATLTEADIKSVEDEVKKTIENSGGKVTKENIWGKRQLAYPIKKKTVGFYVDLEFEATTVAPSDLRELFHTRTSVLRNMIMQVPKAKLIQEKRDAERLKRQKEKAEKERLAAKAAEEAAAEKAAAQAAEAAAAESAPAAETEPASAPAAEAAPTTEPAPEAAPAPAPAPAAEEPKTGE